MTRPDNFAAMVKIIGGLSYRHSAHQVFGDFCEMAAISFSNAVDQRQFEEREARYMAIVKRYSPDEITEFPKLLAHLVECFEEKTDDHLGRLFHELELHNTYKGQFFTPYDLCRMMAKMTLDGTAAAEIIDQRGHVSAAEPACGAGATVLALAQEFTAAGFNHQRQLHVTAVDLDPRCVHMAYIQFTLMHLPAVVVHGNSLTLEEFGHWYTPAHVMGAWSLRTARGNQAETQQDGELQPIPALAGNQPAEAAQPPPEQAKAPAPYVKPTQLTLF